jgi:murein DD-endopeptidase MepM/ murein hydrolase activator NlpD
MIYLRKIFGANIPYLFKGMTKRKYYFNPESLEYEPLNSRRGYVLFRTLGILSFVVIVGAALLIIINSLQKDENRELALYKQQFEIVNEEMEGLRAKMNVLIEQENEVYRAIYDIDPLSEDVRSAGVGGADKYAFLNDYSNSALVKDIRSNLDELDRQFDIQDQSYKDLLKLANSKKELLSRIPSIQPVRNKNLKRVASGYGHRRDPFTGGRKFHAGMDFTARTGTEVFATADGYVEKVVRKRRGYGYHIIINHGYGYKTKYAHLSKFKVTRGTKVKRGQLIGLVGSTGRSTGPHLHYEVLKNGKHMNPAHYYFNDLTDEEYEAMLANAAIQGQSFD